VSVVDSGGASAVLARRFDDEYREHSEEKQPGQRRGVPAEWTTYF
jgi:hypothetical protein